MTRAQDTEAVKEYFEREAGRFDAIYDRGNRTPLQAFVDRLFRSNTLNTRNEIIASFVDENASCFEIGCGSGRTSVEIARARHARVHGIDVAAPMIGIAERLANDAGVGELCRFEVADFDAFTPTETYDTFVAVGVLDYFADPLPMLQRAATAFVPGGSIVLSWPTKRMLLNPVRSAWLATKKVPVAYYAESDIQRLAGALGGHVSQLRTNGRAPLLVDGMARIDLPQ